MINLVLWLVFGALIGWAAGLVMHSREDTIMNIVIGIVGAMIGGFLFGSQTINTGNFSPISLVVSFVGAVILLAVVRLVRRNRPLV